MVSLKHIQKILVLVFFVLGFAVQTLTSSHARAFDCVTEVGRLSAQREGAIREELSSKIILIIGAPGSGKGTQGKLFQKRYGIPSLSTGDALRAEVNQKTPAGLKAQSYMDAGQLVPLDVLMEVVKSQLNNPLYQKGFILDGIPRRHDDRQALEELLASLNRKIDFIFELVVPKDELIRRITERNKIENRSDDKAEVIPERLHVFETETRPVIEYYQKEGRLISIDGMLGIESTFSQIVDTIMKAKNP